MKRSPPFTALNEVYHAKGQKQGHEAVLEEAVSCDFTDGLITKEGFY
jgi:hypothetical protein